MLLTLFIFFLLFIFTYIYTHKLYTSFLISSFLYYLYFFIHIAFWSIPEDIDNILLHINLTPQTLNIIFLIPLGFYLVELFKIKRYYLLLIISLLIPFIIEFIQEFLTSYNKIFIYHTFDIIDIKCNFLGCFLSSFTTLTIRKILLKDLQLDNIN